MTGGSWTKSTYSGTGNCVEVRPWTKARASGNNGCVELRQADPAGVQMRDSKLGDDSPVLTFTAAAWQEFIRGIRDGDRPCTASPGSASEPSPE
jgi:hypothetical protein